MNLNNTSSTYHIDTNTIITSSFDSGQTSIWGGLSELSQQYHDMNEKIEQLESENYLLKLRLLKLEQVFNDSEIENLKCMLRSVDPSSVELAKHIIKNA